MFSWLNRKAQAVAEPKGYVSQGTLQSVANEESAIRAALGKLDLLLVGIPRVEPATKEEWDFVIQFKDAVQQCRKTFAWPGFDLPTLPATALRIMKLLQEPEPSPRKLAQVLQADFVLTAKFLRLANSPFYAGARRVESVQAAIDRLGLTTVRGIVLAISLNIIIIRAKELGNSALELWEHSINTGLAAQGLAELFELSVPLSFTLGVMHNIGKLPCMLIASNLLKKRAGIRPAVIETLIEDMHTEVGRVLGEVWNMPKEVQIVVGGHHSVTDIAEATAYVKAEMLEASAEEHVTMAKQLGCVVLADKSLATLRLAREPGDLTVSESPFATELGLGPKESLVYLSELPKVILDNNLKNL